MRIKFWGTRGSIPVAEPEMMKYGGNTACVEVRLYSGDILIFDAGTGIRRLGIDLLNDPSFNKKGHILISHCHWDHIQGFPFFTPAFMPEYSWTIYGQFKLDGRLEDLLRWQMEHLYFPVTLDQMGATMKFVEIIEEDFHIGSAKITARHLHHPQGNMGFRVEDRDGIFVYCTDTEHYSNGLDPKLMELAHNADVLVYDGQYTEEEYRTHIGWGHSTWQAGVEIAKAANVKKLLLFHHDPNHNDEQIDRIIGEARQIFPETYGVERDMTLQIDEFSKMSCDHKSLDDIKDRISFDDRSLQIKLSKFLKVFNHVEFFDIIKECLRNRNLRICVLNFEEVEEIDSSALKTLARFYDELKRMNIQMKLIKVSSQVQEVLKITRFIGVVEVE